MSDCDTRAKSQNAYKKVTSWYEGKVDKAFDTVGNVLKKYDTKGWIIPTDVQNSVADMLNAFRARKNDIYRAADKIKQHLDTFSKEDSENIVRALNGDKSADILSGKAFETYKRMRALIDHNADELIKAGALDEKSKIKDYLKRYYEAYFNDQAKLAKLFNNKVFSRKNMTYEERIALGMIEDASYVIPRTLAEQRVQLIKADFFKQLADSFGEDMRLGEDWVQIEKTQVGAGIYKYGALAGKYVPLHVKKMLDDAHILADELGFTEKYLFPIIDHIKVNVTVKNPVTHVYNVLSNIQLSAIQGTIQNIPHVFDMMRNDKEAFGSLMQELEVFGLDSMLKDMETPQVFSNKKGVNIVMSILKNMYFSQNSKSGDALRHVYDWEDKIFKVAAYESMSREATQKLGRALSQEEKLKIYKEAVAPYANYSTPLPASVKLLDKTGISPFLHYIYKSTPAVAKLIAKNPLKFAAIQAVLIATGASIFSEEQEDALTPEWAGEKSKINLFGTKDWVRFANGLYWNAGRMMPGMKIGAIDASGGFVGGAINIANGKTPLGYNIGSKYDNLAESLLERFAALAENYAPPLTFGRYGQRAVKKISGEELLNYYKEDMTWQELGTRMLGVRKFNESKEAQSKIRAAHNRFKHFTETDPTNESVYLAELNNKLAEIKKQADAKRVAVTPPKTSTKSTKIFKPFIKKSGLIDLGF